MGCLHDPNGDDLTRSGSAVNPAHDTMAPRPKTQRSSALTAPQQVQCGPHSPTAEAIGLNPMRVRVRIPRRAPAFAGARLRSASLQHPAEGVAAISALIAQPAEAAASNPAQCRFDSCSAHEPSPLSRLRLAKPPEAANAARRSFSEGGSDDKNSLP